MPTGLPRIAAADHDRMSAFERHVIAVEEPDDSRRCAGRKAALAERHGGE
jgi:hypothetical protein